MFIYVIEMNTNNAFYLPDAGGSGIKVPGSPAPEQLAGETDKYTAKLRGSSRRSGSLREGLSGYREWAGVQKEGRGQL